MDDILDHNDIPSSPRYFEEEEEEVEEEDLEMFQPPVSGFGESETQSLEEVEVEEDGEEGEEGEEGDGSKIDDAHIENTAIQIYQDMHPSREQIAVGGREIGEHEAIWSVSTFRPDWGPDKLRDNNALTYWQSDCPNPNKNHTVDLNFHQATFIRQVSLFIDFFQDESYTPKTIAIRGGTTSRDLYVIVVNIKSLKHWSNG
ncbi:galactose-binding domain-like protein [Thamnidium elegans]|nr:galactose-binding domain-like protein [Thamnidium elegans]